MLHYVRMVSNHMQIKSHPAGSPTLIPPSVERIDYKKLSIHAKQCRQRCGISEEAQRWWLDYLDSLKNSNSESHSESATKWPLTELIERTKAKDSEHLLKR